MKTYLITITLPDGSRTRSYGRHADGFDAVIAAMDAFPQAKRICARRLA